MTYHYKTTPPLGLRLWIQESEFEADPTLALRFEADGVPENVFWALHVDIWAGDLDALDLFRPLMEDLAPIGVSCENMAAVRSVVEAAGYVLDQGGDPQ